MTVNRKRPQKLSEIYRKAASDIARHGSEILQKYLLNPNRFSSRDKGYLAYDVGNLGMCDAIRDIPRAGLTEGQIDTAIQLLHVLFNQKQKGTYWFGAHRCNLETAIEFMNTRILILCLAADIGEDMENSSCPFF